MAAQSGYRMGRAHASMQTRAAEQRAETTEPGYRMRRGTPRPPAEALRPPKTGRGKDAQTGYRMRRAHARSEKMAKEKVAAARRARILYKAWETATGRKQKNISAKLRKLYEYQHFAPQERCLQKHVLKERKRRSPSPDTVCARRQHARPARIPYAAN